jgi:hypothetical protein
MSRETMCGKCCKKGDPLRQLTKSPTMRLAECQACARTERRKRVRLDKALVWIAQQPCRAEAEGADGKHITCRDTGACATEWCLPCYAAAALAAWRKAGGA